MLQTAHNWQRSAPTLARSLLSKLASDLGDAADNTAEPTAPVWTPQAGPQALAYASDADVIGYGGAAGGGKSDLALGMAGMQHRRSIIFRRVFPSLRGMIERSREIFNAPSRPHAKDSFNESLHVWRLEDGRMIEFGAVQHDDDRKKHQGQPRDFMAFDEATEFPEMTVRFLMGWNRTTTTNQRCRVLLTFNPPMDDAGEWIVRFFAPWLDADYADPAEDGELRYVAMDDGVERFYRAPENAPEGALLKTRTFFHASLKDNPILEASGYAATIEALPEPLRSFLKGNFHAARIANPWQVIPTEWVRAAEKRHAARGRPDVPLQAVGADIARGGKDRMSIAKLYGNYLAPIECHPGSHVTNGPIGAALLLPYAIPGVRLSVDVISIGSSVYDSLVANDVAVEGVNFGAGAGDLRDRSKRLKFKNIRAAAYWKLREALDPDNGDSFALPDDPELREELCAARFEITSQGILLEDKKEIIKRIGRSPDKADALALAYWGIVGIKKPTKPAPPIGMTSVSKWRS